MIVHLRLKYAFLCYCYKRFKLTQETTLTYASVAISTKNNSRINLVAQKLCNSFLIKQDRTFKFQKKNCLGNGQFERFVLLKKALVYWAVSGFFSSRPSSESQPLVARGKAHSLIESDNHAIERSRKGKVFHADIKLSKMCQKCLCVIVIFREVGDNGDLINFQVF